jgi:hypothetical protein
VIPSIIVAIGLEGAVATWALRWALPKSDTAFFSIFAGDALLRLVGLGLATWWLWSRQLPYKAPLLTFGFGYLLVSIVQIPFLHKAR